MAVGVIGPDGQNLTLGARATEARRRLYVGRFDPSETTQLRDRTLRLGLFARPQFHLKRVPTARRSRSGSQPFVCWWQTSVIGGWNESSVRHGAGRFNAFSAGSQPKAVVNPYALKTLAEYGYPAAGLRSKSWDEFAGITAHY